MKKNNSIAVSIFCILFLALPLFAADGVIQVKCLDPSGNVLKGVKVSVIVLGTNKAKDKNSDSQGIAEFTKLDDGVYRVVGRKEGYIPTLFEYVVLKGDQKPVTLPFQIGADKQFYFEDGAIINKSREFQQQAKEAAVAKKFDEAEKLLRQSLELYPTNIDAFLMLATYYLLEEKYDQGVNELKKAVDLCSQLKTFPQSPGIEGAELYENSIQKAQALLKSVPGIKAEKALSQKKYDEAIVLYSEALKGDPDNHPYLANLAVALANAQQYDAALQAVDKAIQLSPQEKAYTDLKNRIAAKKTSANLEKAQVLLNEGDKLYKADDAAGALKKFEESKALIPENKQYVVYRAIARALAKLGQTNAAIEAFKKAIDISPADKVEESRKMLAQYYVEDLKQFNEALAFLTDPKALGAQSEEQIYLSVVKTYEQDFPKLAEMALERVIVINPQNAEAYYNLGRMYFADGKENDKRSRELFTKYIEIGKNEVNLTTAKDYLVVISKRSAK
jgi:tetratricopeptide (TPR) repeat protein